MSKHLKSAWVTEWRKEAKPWGHEMVWSSFEAGHGKMLFLKKGHRTSLKFNPQKSEALIVISGKVEALFGNELTIRASTANPWESAILQPGVSLNVQSGCPYRLTALEDSTIIEIGNHLLDTPIRIEDDYGRG